MFIEMKISPTICQELINAWEKEHEKYYGKPCGLAQPKTLERSEELKAYTGIEHPEWHFNCGYNKIGDFHVWVRSFGTWTAVTPNGRLIAGGRRHALQAQLAEFSDDVRRAEMISIISQEPDRRLFD
jgi:hypothetical protein